MPIANEMLKVSAASIALKRMRDRQMQKQAMGNLGKILTGLGIGGAGAAAYSQKDEIAGLIKKLLGKEDEGIPWETDSEPRVPPWLEDEDLPWLRDLEGWESE